MSRSATPTTDSSTAVFTLRLPREKLDRFRELAEADHRTISQELRRFIDESISAADERAAAA